MHFFIETTTIYLIFSCSFASSDNNNDTDELGDFDGASIVPSSNKTLPPDGCSLKSQDDAQPSQKNSSQSAKPSQPSPPSSSDTRGEVEGSSDNNSPPTSVIQGTNKSMFDKHFWGTLMRVVWH